MVRPLAGKVALVTGASRGIGAAIAERLAAEGAEIAINYSRQSHAQAGDEAAALLSRIAAGGGRGVLVDADMADAEAATEMVRNAARKLGRLDILVNNAGVLVRGRIDDPERDPAAFARQFAVNLGSVVASVAAAVEFLPDEGRIILIGSSAAARVPFPGIADYAAGKAALTGYCHGWARDLGRRGITVNVVQPGAIATAINPLDGDLAAPLLELAALKRFGQPSDIAAAVAYLAGPGGSYVTGSVLNVDGGQIC